MKSTQVVENKFKRYILSGRLVNANCHTPLIHKLFVVNINNQGYFALYNWKCDCAQNNVSKFVTAEWTFFSDLEI